MPLTEKGARILAEMQKQYGEEEGERVFYASKNAGKLTGVDHYPSTRIDVHSASGNVTVSRQP